MIEKITNKKNQRKKGFTLIELIIVVAILAVLGTVVGFIIGGELDKSKQQAANSSADIIKTKLDSMLTMQKAGMENTNYFDTSKDSWGEFEKDSNFEGEIKSLKKMKENSLVYIYIKGTGTDAQILGVTYQEANGKVGSVGEVKMKDDGKPADDVKYVLLTVNAQGILDFPQ